MSPRQQWNPEGFWRASRGRVMPVGRRRAKLMRRPIARELDHEGPKIGRFLGAALLGVLLLLFAIFLITRSDIRSPFGDAVGAPIEVPR